MENARREQTVGASASALIGRREALAIVAVWTCLGLVETAKAYTSARLRGVPQTWTHALIGNMPWWYAWALLTPAAFLLASRFRLDRRPVAGAVTVHSAASIGMALVHLFPVGALYWYTHTRFVPDGPSLPTLLRNFVDSYGMLGVLTYWGVVGGFYALDFHRRFRASELQAARLESRAAQLETLTTEARLNALRMELNPHFLFNTLNAISGLVRRSERDGAVAMLARLGDLLRLTLNRDRPQQVPLTDELESLGLYMDIERIRFGERLRITIDVDDAAGGALVPALILQPIVENAIRHGIARTPGPGHLGVTARVSGGWLRITVADTGPGFPACAVDGVGLSNTRARIAQLYGEQASLDHAPARVRGSVVTLTIPFHQAAPVSDGAAVMQEQA